MEFPESLLDFPHHDPLLTYVFLYDTCISAPTLTYHNQIKIWPLQRSQMNPPLLGHIVPGAACFLVLYSLAMSYHRSVVRQLASWSPHCYSYLAKESGPCRLLSSSTGWSVATWGVTSAEYSQKVTGYCIRCLCTAASTISASSANLSYLYFNVMTMALVSVHLLLLLLQFLKGKFIWQVSFSSIHLKGNHNTIKDLNQGLGISYKHTDQNPKVLVLCLEISLLT